MATHKKVKLLLIASYPVIPAEAGGKIRILQLAKGLAQSGLDVTILMPFHFSGRSPIEKDMAFHIKVLYYPFLIPFLFSEKPFPFWYLVSIHPGVSFFLPKDFKNYDIYQFENPAFSDLIEKIPKGKPIFYDAHNVQYDYVRSECPSEWVRGWASPRVHRFEKNVVEASKKVFCCSKDDKSKLASLYHCSPEKIIVVPNGIKKMARPGLRFEDSSVLKTHPRLVHFKRRFVFSGNDVIHNRVAVEFIMNRLAPKMEKDCAFILHGPCGRKFRNRKKPNVFIDMKYNGFERYAYPGTVALNPMTQGSGSNLKVINYLSHFVPVVSTEFGMRGFENLKPFVRIVNLEHFHEGLLNPKRLSPNIENILKPYLWKEVAKLPFDAYREACPGLK